ncbi:glycosyltransferase [Turicimonas muris]|uniref:glycosyltransferase n=1 Tax=Turicimonas muris TaxID=1796652 RepID=UPI0024950B12|nr:glycosyltransferase [Turicimonas muris]
MEQRPFVSILIPCCNVEKFIQQCLLSVINQTLKNIEIICINDGSTDGSQQILEKIAKQDSRIRIINKQNTGYGDSMNRGLDAALSEYIGIVEGDDFVTPEMFEMLYQQAKKKDLDICRGAHFNLYGDQAYPEVPSFLPSKRVIDSCQFEKMLKLRPAIWTSIYKKDFLRKNGIRFLGTPGASYQDTSFAIKCWLTAQRVALLPLPLIYYRCDNAASSVKQKDKVYFICEEWREIYTFLFKQKLSSPARLKILFEVQFNNYLWNLKRVAWKYKAQFLIRWFCEAWKFLLKFNISFSQLPTKLRIKILLLLFFPVFYLFLSLFDNDK